MKKTKVTEAGYIFSLVSGIIILVVTIIAISIISILTRYLGNLLGIFAYILLGMHLLSGILITIGSILIKKEDHSLAGSILVLVVSSVGILIGTGLYIGPAVGLVGGILGLKEHQRLILHKK